MIAFIDCFIETPVHHCFNQFVQNTHIPATYHMVSHYGLDSLELVAEKTKAYIILGSASNVDHQLSWHRPLAEFIDKKLKEGIPVMGICFGHQLMADFYGSKVSYLTVDQTHFKEVREIKFCKDFDHFKTGETVKLAYAHEQAILELSDQFEIIASSKRSNFEVIKHKTLPYLSTQAHPEASAKFIQEILNSDNDEGTIGAGQQFLLSFLNYFQIDYPQDSNQPQ